MRSAKRTFASIKIGDTASIRRPITAADIRAFARLSGDSNPLHTDDAYARKTAFRKRVVHGFFLGSLVSRLIGMRLPGAYSLLVRETLEFKKPVFAGDILDVRASVAHTSAAGRLVELAIEIQRKRDLVCSGSAHVHMLK